MNMAVTLYYIGHTDNFNSLSLTHLVVMQTGFVCLHPLTSLGISLEGSVSCSSCVGINLFYDSLAGILPERPTGWHYLILQLLQKTQCDQSA